MLERQRLLPFESVSCEVSDVKQLDTQLTDVITVVAVEVFKKPEKFFSGITNRLILVSWFLRVRKRTHM